MLDHDHWTLPTDEASSCNSGFDDPPCPHEQPGICADGAWRKRRVARRLGGQEPLPAVPQRGRFPAPCRRPRRRRRAQRRTAARAPPPTGAAGPRTWSGNCASTAAGRLTETCQRDGERENYLPAGSPASACASSARCPPGATCTWSFDDGTPPPRHVTVPCDDEIKLRVRYGRPTIAAVGIVRADNSVDSVSAEIRVQDFLIAGMGDFGRGRRRQSRPRGRARRSRVLLPAVPRRRRQRVFPSEPGRIFGRQGVSRHARRPRRSCGATGRVTARAGCRRPATARSTATSFAPRLRLRSRIRKSR